MNSEAEEQSSPAIEDATPVWQGPRRILALIGAGVSLTLAILGLLLPLIPATPFVLLASYLLVRSSVTLHRRLKNSRLFGRVLRDWEQNGGIRFRDKMRAAAIVVGCSCVSLAVLRPQGVQLVIALIVIAFGLIVILSLPNARRESAGNQAGPALLPGNEDQSDTGI